MRAGVFCGALCLVGCAGDHERDIDGSTGMVADAPPQPPAVYGASVCSEAEVIGVGRWRGGFEARSVALTGGCAAPGPVAHFAVQVDAAGDIAISAEAPRFVPEIGVRFEHCDHAWSVCRRGATDWLPDVAAGTRLLVAVSAPIEEILPDRIGSAPTDFDFTLAIRSRRISAAGEPCDDDTRCESGTRCAVSDAGGTFRACTPVVGDRCSSAIEVPLVAGMSLVLPTPEEPWPGSDHEHACGGGDRPEWVYRLVPVDAAGGTLRVSGSPGTLLAIRAASCLPADEIACGEDALTLVPEVWGGSEPLFLFVEAPQHEGDATPQAPIVRAEWMTSDA